MSRLASLTPSRSRARNSLSPSPSPAPSLSSLQTETTHHRMLKLVLAEIKNVLKTWDELVMIDGFKAAKGCVDEATEMDNLIGVDERPERPEIGPHLAALYAHRIALKMVLTKLDNNLGKLNTLADQAEKILFAACQRESMEFVFVEPLWLTWTLEQFVNSLSPLISQHTSHLATIASLSTTILSPSTSFDDAKFNLEAYRDIAMGGERYQYTREWEELVEIEVGAGREDEDEDEDEIEMRKARRKGKR
ncbi:hypothetical protein CI109_102482 [Kwoniella shandongensis]|uniref:Uncharacterized protein n=1 Tax=Kwoniella shandongensis TaxID=1734106 RepID=A0A5M6C0S3_9TREE|nr:uncharacterized protein CI109_003199 [Kwoniella shandongensis]KAA5528301.1 hypothetical protein CI109_003199 [Kwoniella shandongensis]